MAACAASGVGGTGVEVSSMAPIARTDRARTVPPVSVARTSSTSRWAAASSAASWSRAAAHRITAPVPDATRPLARATSATASHSAPASGLPWGRAALVPLARR